jgi:hypothetical protein
MIQPFFGHDLAPVSAMIWLSFGHDPPYGTRIRPQLGILLDI